VEFEDFEYDRFVDDSDREGKSREYRSLVLLNIEPKLST